MMRLLALFALAGAAHAQTPLDAQAFETYTQGRTLTFSANGAPYGAEQYGRDRQVRWSFLDGECLEGRWYPQGEQICFVYEDMAGPRCWTFYRDAGGLSARFADDPDGSVLYETAASEEPLVCPGPKVGV